MRVSGNNRQQQLEIANAIKIAREMALLPYARRVASTGRPGRGGRDRDGGRDGGRPPRDESRDSQVDSGADSTDQADTGVADGVAADTTTDESEG
jgi:small subunit ribosomal protein S18